jgi:hypothetical protein
MARTEELPDSTEDLRTLDQVLKCPKCGDRRRRISGNWLCIIPGHTGLMGSALFAKLIDDRLRRLKGETPEARDKRVDRLVKQAEQEERQMTYLTQRTKN